LIMNKFFLLITYVFMYFFFFMLVSFHSPVISLFFPHQTFGHTEEGSWLSILVIRKDTCYPFQLWLVIYIRFLLLLQC